VIDSATDASIRLASFLRLMADPTRRRIFLHLMRGEICNCEMVERLGLAQNLISHHLRQLREIGLIRARRDSADQRWIYYSIDRDALADVHSELTHLFDPSAIGLRAPDCGPPQD
jgi:DNA-binding transcriptional ArsR family regulator